MLGKAFIKEVNEACTNILVAIGMKRQCRGIVTLKLTEECIGWIGLNSATRESNTAMYVNPVVGIRYNPIHKLISEIKNKKYHKYMPPTIAMNIGYIMPEKTFKSYEFIKGEEILPVANEIANDVENYVIAFMTNNTSLDKITNLLYEKGIWQFANEYLLAIYHIMGKSESEIDLFIETRIEEGKQEGYYFPILKEFYEQYKKYISRYNESS